MPYFSPRTGLPDFPRRDFLRTLGYGLPLAGLLQARASGELIAPAGETTLEPIKACIFIFYYGGPSHLDTWDMKPDAPAEIRGEFQPIDTSAPGVQISEHLPHLSRVMHKVAIVRSMHHKNRLHDSAGTETLTGRPARNGDVENFAPMAEFIPSYGSVVSYMNRERNLDVGYASLPWVFHNVVPVPCQGAGFLGKSFDPFRITGNPEKTTYRAEMLDRSEGLSGQRVSNRRDLLAELEAGRRAVPETNGTQQLRALYEKAYRLLDSELVRRALDIEQEDRALRERYGLPGQVTQGGGNGAEKAYGRNLRGQNLLLARRLVEAGIPFVTVYDFKQQGQNWDSHSDNFGQHKKYLLPAADRALSALIEDLDQRGLLESTLIVGAGEFGRTPKINGNAGRDHWPDCYSVLLAGGGVRGGATYGSSDAHGAFPASDPFTPADLAATIFWRFGLNPDTVLHDKTGRPWRLSDGETVRDVFGA